MTANDVQTLPASTSLFSVHMWAEFPRSLSSEENDQTFADLSIVFLALQTGSDVLASTTSDAVSHKTPEPRRTNRLPSLQTISPEEPLRAMVAKIEGNSAYVTFL